MTEEKSEKIIEEMEATKVWENGGKIANAIFTESIKDNVHPAIMAYAGIEIMLHSIHSAADGQIPDMFKEHIAECLRSIADDVAPKVIIETATRH